MWDGIDEEANLNGWIVPANYIIKTGAKMTAFSGKKEYKPINDRAIIPLTLSQLNR